MLDQRSPHLQREQRVAQRRLDDPSQQLPRQTQPEPLGQQPSGRAEAQRTDLQTLQHSALERPLQRGPTTGTPGEQEANRLVLEPTSRERERVRRRTIEPLDVVDRDQHRAASGQRTQPIQQAKVDRMLSWRDVRRLGPQQRHLQRDR